MGDLKKHEKENIMAIIGKFTKQENGSFFGSITTLTISTLAAFEPAPKKSDKSPDYRLIADDCEIGAAWERTTDGGQTHLSVRLDDPSFAAPINCRLIKTGSESGHSLIWERTRPRD